MRVIVSPRYNFLCKHKMIINVMYHWLHNYLIIVFGKNKTLNDKYKTFKCNYT